MIGFDGFVFKSQNGENSKNRNTDNFLNYFEFDQ